MENEMDMEWKWSGNGAQVVKIVWIGLDLGQIVDLKPYDRYRTFTKHDISNTETRFYLIDWQICAKVEGLDANPANLFQHDTGKNSSYFDMDCCPIKF